MNDKKHIQLKRGDDAVFDFSYIVNHSNGEAVKEVIFGYYEREMFKQIIAVHTKNLNLNFNPTFNTTWKGKINITADVTSTAKLKLRKVVEETLFDITFYCKISTGWKEKTSEIKLEIVCKYAINAYFLFNFSPDSNKVLIV